MSELGPLPEPALPKGRYGYRVAHEDYFTAAQMHSYAQQEVEKERERCAKLVEAQDTNGDYGVRSWFELLSAKIRA